MGEVAALRQLVGQVQELWDLYGANAHPLPRWGKTYLPLSLSRSLVTPRSPQPHFSSLSLPLLPPLRPRPPSSLPPAWRSDLLAFRGLRGELRRPRKLFFVCRFIDLPDIPRFVQFRPGEEI